MIAQKSLVFVALVLSVCQLVSATYEIVAVNKAIGAIYGQKPLTFEETKEHFELINKELDTESGGMDMMMKPELRDIWIKIALYTSSCEAQAGPFGLQHRMADMLINKMISDEKKGKNSPNIINYLEECKKRRTSQ